jgi:NAD-dependent dihydropyrimidine dehydrogenase PreA subunit
MVILPQLAATGIDARKVQKRGGWKVVWGPVDAPDLPTFLRRGMDAPAALRAVSFGWRQRTEMAVAWAFPISAFVGLALFFLWRAALLPAVLLTWALALLVLLAFPLYERWLGSPRQLFERGGLQLLLWVLCLLGLAVYAFPFGTLTWAWLWRWGALALILVVLVTVDLTGMTPVFKSGTHEDRQFHIAFDADLCVGDGVCEQVCPRDCFVLDREQGKAMMLRAARCVQCGACIVQCPGDALSFVGPVGEVLAPETVRRYKLNLMGKRAQPRS